MNVPEENEKHRLPRVRFSIGSLLLWTAMIALAVNSLIMSRTVSQLKQELAPQLDLPPSEVARQFERATKVGPIATTVRDVRYSEASDAYRIDFSWTDSTSGKTWYSDVQLNHDGFGVYIGQIRNSPFLQPLGHKNPFSVAVEKPSSFTK